MGGVRALIQVTWADAHGSGAGNAYAEHEIPHSPIIIRTVGWLLRQDAAGVSLACEVCEDGTFRGVTFVPAGMIQGEVEVLIPAQALRRTPRPRRSKVQAGAPPPAAPDTAAALLGAV